MRGYRTLPSDLIKGLVDGLYENFARAGWVYDRAEFDRRLAALSDEEFDHVFNQHGHTIRKLVGHIDAVLRMPESSEYANCEDYIKYPRDQFDPLKLERW